MLKLTLSLSFFIMLLINSTYSVHANDIIFQDNFDDNDISDWRVVRNYQVNRRDLPCMFGDIPAAWKNTDGFIDISILGPHCITEIIPDQFYLNNIKNFEYNVDITLRQSAHMDRNVLFLWKDENNWYDLHLIGNSIGIQKVVNGNVYGITGGASGYGLSLNTPHHFKIRMRDNRIIVSVNEQEIINVEDQEPYIEGDKTFGLQASVGSIPISITQFDNILVRDLENADTVLNVPSYKQNAQQWGNQIYDHALSWADDPTMTRWGCAVSSAAMILNYHGMHHLPDGRELNPDTLNNWLTHQTDGYVNGGLVNWMAISRLTRELSQLINVPELKYSRFNNSSTETAISETDAQRPSILQIDGHFLVSKGYDIQQDLLINDPFYSYQKFSEHNTPLLSTRTLTPANSDISGLLISSSLATNLQLSTPDQTLTGAEQQTEYIADPETGTTSPYLHTIEYMQPANGQYQLQMTTEVPFQPFMTEIYAYTKEGAVTAEKLEGITNLEGIAVATIRYDSSSGSTITPESTSFTKLGKEIKVLYDQGKIQKLLFFTLDQSFKNIEKAGRKEQLLRIEVMKKVLNHLNKQIDPAAGAYILYQLNQLESQISEV